MPALLTKIPSMVPFWKLLFALHFEWLQLPKAGANSGVLVDLDRGSVTFASDGAWGESWNPHITQEDMPCDSDQWLVISGWWSTSKVIGFQTVGCWKVKPSIWGFDKYPLDPMVWWWMLWFPPFQPSWAVYCSHIFTEIFANAIMALSHRNPTSETSDAKSLKLGHFMSCLRLSWRTLPCAVGQRLCHFPVWSWLQISSSVAWLFFWPSWLTWLRVVLNQTIALRALLYVALNMWSYRTGVYLWRNRLDSSIRGSVECRKVGIYHLTATSMTSRPAILHQEELLRFSPLGETGWSAHWQPSSGMFGRFKYLQGDQKLQLQQKGGCRALDASHCRTLRYFVMSCF